MRVGVRLRRKGEIMRLSDQQFAEYEREGLLLIPGYFSSSEIEVMRREVDALAHEDRASRVLETDKVTVRALHGCHLDSEVFGSLTRLPRLLEPAQRLLGGDVYVHQFKVNMKAAFGGDVWPWHQDYVFWLKEDGMATPRATNIAILADDVTEFNGPMYFIPGSHRAGVIDVPELVADDPGSSDGWVANVSAKLKYTLDRHTVAGLVDRFGMVSPKGPAGSVAHYPDVQQRREHSEARGRAAAGVPGQPRLFAADTTRGRCTAECELRGSTSLRLIGLSRGTGGRASLAPRTAVPRQLDSS
jgi:ectoine hydroxylase